MWHQTSQRSVVIWLKEVLELMFKSIYGNEEARIIEKLGLVKLTDFVDIFVDHRVLCISLSPICIVQTRATLNCMFANK